MKSTLRSRSTMVTVAAAGQGSASSSAKAPTTSWTGNQCLADARTIDSRSGSPASDQDTGSRRSPGRLRMRAPPGSAPYFLSSVDIDLLP